MTGSRVTGCVLAAVVGFLLGVLYERWKKRRKAEEALKVTEKEMVRRGAPEPLTRQEKWDQLANAVAGRSSQDQVLWSLFSTFWAANALLLVALFTTGDLPHPGVGRVVSAVGALISVAWHLNQRRMLGKLRLHDDLICTLEGELNFEERFALTPELNSVARKHLDQKIKGRQVMPVCSMAGVLLWLLAAFYFLGKRF